MKEIPGFPGYYATKDGRIWSERFCHSTRKGWLHPKVKKDAGYLSVVLRRDGKKYYRRVSRLVLETFVGPCPPGMEACHDPDPNPANNHLGNLRWDTHKANQEDAVSHGTATCLRCRGERCNLSKLAEADVRLVMHLYTVEGWTQAALADRFNVTPQAISAITRRKAWRFLWQ